jgi:hypothetical protein
MCIIKHGAGRFGQAFEVEMGEGLKQDKRIAALTTPLGKDRLVLSAFEATEGLSEPRSAW